MNKSQKSELAQLLTEKFGKAKVAVFADYKGLSANQADELRRSLRVHQAEVKVLKNNIARVITKDGQMGDEAKAVMDSLVGPTLVAFAYNDPAAVAKVINQFSKDNEALILKDSLLGRKKITASDVEALASLPSKEVLLSTLLGTLNAPVQGFVSVLAAVPRGLVTVLSAIEKKKSESSS